MIALLIIIVSPDQKSQTNIANIEERLNVLDSIQQDMSLQINYILEGLNALYSYGIQSLTIVDSLIKEVKIIRDRSLENYQKIINLILFPEIFEAKDETRPVRNNDEFKVKKNVRDYNGH